MAAVNPFIQIIIGLAITIISSFDKSVAFRLFFWVGILILAWGIIKLIIGFVMRPKKEKPKPQLSQREEQIRRYQQHQQQMQQQKQNTHPTWHQQQNDPYKQHNVHKKPTPAARFCPNCGKAKDPRHRFCPSCGYGV